MLNVRKVFDIIDSIEIIIFKYDNAGWKHSVDMGKWKRP